METIEARLAGQAHEIIDGLVETIQGMRREMEALKQNQPAGELEQAKDYLIDLVGPDIIWQEQNLDKMMGNKQERMKEVIDAYRAVRPKEGEKE